MSLTVQKEDNIIGVGGRGVAGSRFDEPRMPWGKNKKTKKSACTNWGDPESRFGTEKNASRSGKNDGKNGGGSRDCPDPGRTMFGERKGFSTDLSEKL